MVQAEISVLDFTFPDKIGWKLFSFTPEIWMLAGAIAAAALLFAVVFTVNSVIRYRREQRFLGTLMLSVFSLLFALWCVSESGMIEKYSAFPLEVLNIVQYALYTLCVVIFLAHILLYYFEANVVSTTVIVVFALMGAAVFVLDALRIVTLAQGDFALTVVSILLLLVLAIIAFIRLVQTGKANFILYLIMLVVCGGALAFNLFNARYELAPEYLFDYRLIAVGYLIVLTINCFFELTAARIKEPLDDLPVTEELPPVAKEPQGPEGRNVDLLTPEEELLNEAPIGKVEVVDITEGETTAVEEKKPVPTEPVSAEPDAKEPAVPVGSQADALIAKVNAAKHKGEPPMDYLTGTLTRSHFMAALSEPLADSEDRNVAVVVMDIENLRRINESAGFAAGDRVIRALAEAITRTFAEVGTVYRIDGDEFAVIVRNARPGVISKHILLLLDQIKKDNMQSGIAWDISFGYAVYSGKTQMSLEDLTGLAQKRMREKSHV